MNWCQNCLEWSTAKSLRIEKLLEVFPTLELKENGKILIGSIDPADDLMTTHREARLKTAKVGQKKLVLTNTKETHRILSASDIITPESTIFETGMHCYPSRDCARVLHFYRGIPVCKLGEFLGVARLKNSVLEEWTMKPPDKSAIEYYYLHKNNNNQEAVPPKKRSKIENTKDF